VKAEFGKGRMPVTATFDGKSYEGSLIKMKTPCHIIGIRKEICVKIATDVRKKLIGKILCII